jgi:hypothetical protein
MWNYPEVSTGKRVLFRAAGLELTTCRVVSSGPKAALGAGGLSLREAYNQVSRCCGWKDRWDLERMAKRCPAPKAGCRIKIIVIIMMMTPIS